MSTPNETVAQTTLDENSQSRLPPAFSAAGWVLVVVWLYIHVFVFEANATPQAAWLQGIVGLLFKAASVLGFWGGPLWTVAAVTWLISRRGPQGVTWHDLGLASTVVGLMGAHLYLASLD